MATLVNTVLNRPVACKVRNITSRAGFCLLCGAWRISDVICTWDVRLSHRSVPMLTVVWDVTPCSLVHRYHLTFLYGEDRVRRFLQSFGTCISDYTESHTTEHRKSRIYLCWRWSEAWILFFLCYYIKTWEARGIRPLFMDAGDMKACVCPHMNPFCLPTAT